LLSYPYVFLGNITNETDAYFERGTDVINLVDRADDNKRNFPKMDIEDLFKHADTIRQLNESNEASMFIGYAGFHDLYFSAHDQELRLKRTHQTLMQATVIPLQEYLGIVAMQEKIKSCFVDGC